MRKNSTEYEKTSGLTLTVVRREHADNVPEGQVISQNPETRNRTCKEVDKVEVVVSKGAEKKHVKSLCTYSDD